MHPTPPSANGPEGSAAPGQPAVPTSLLSADNVRGRALFKALDGAPELDIQPWTEDTDQPMSEVLIYDAVSRGDGMAPDLTEASEIFLRCRHLPLVHVIVISSSRVFEPTHMHPGRVGEDYWPALGGGRRPGNELAGRWRELEDLVRRHSESDEGPRWTLLRCAEVPLPGGRDPLSRRLGRRRATVVAGRDPVVQMLSIDDLAAAVRAVVRRLQQGLPHHAVLHVAPRGAVHWRTALRLAGTRPVAVPGWLMRGSKHETAYWKAPWTLGADTLQGEDGVPSPRPHTEILETFRAAKKASRREAEPPPVQPWTEDPFGVDEDYIAAFDRTLFGFLHQKYWRVEVRGLEHVPPDGAAVLVGSHRGFMPWDGVMTLHSIRQGAGRTVRFLIHPALLKFPFLANYMTKLGGIVARQQNGDWVLDQGELLGVYPEGIRGAFAPYDKDVYKLRSFGRWDFVKMALRHRVPMVPFVCVGSAEIYPIFHKFRWRWFQRAFEWPSLPVTPTMGTVPLPSKWFLCFLPPMQETVELGPEAADDPQVVRELGNTVRDRMQQTLDGMVRHRKSIFRGPWPEGPEEET